MGEDFIDDHVGERKVIILAWSRGGIKLDDGGPAVGQTSLGNAALLLGVIDAIDEAGISRVKQEIATAGREFEIDMVQAVVGFVIGDPFDPVLSADVARAEDGEFGLARFRGVVT